MNEQEKIALVKYRITISKEILKEVDILVENKLWNTAVNRLYYVCYYAAKALLLNHNIIIQDHSEVSKMFDEEFVKSGIMTKKTVEVYSDIYNKWLTSENDDFIDFNEIDIMGYKNPVKDLILTIENLIEY